MRFSGIVGKGKGFGSVIGFPTANIPLADTAVSGIYAAVVDLKGVEHPAAAYADQERGLLEAHLLDFAGDLYGQKIAITLIEKIREAKQFPNEKELKAAIAADVAKIRDSFHHEGNVYRHHNGHGKSEGSTGDGTRPNR